MCNGRQGAVGCALPLTVMGDTQIRRNDWDPRQMLPAEQFRRGSDGTPGPDTRARICYRVTNAV